MAIPLFTSVRLLKPVEAWLGKSKGVDEHPAGTRGVILDVHDGGQAYEVEVFHPPDVLTVVHDDLAVIENQEGADDG